MLSNTCKYAVRAIVYLAMKDNGTDKIGIKQISSDLSIPTPFLGKILQILAKHKMLSSTKGPHGGFGITANTRNVTLFDIVQLFDGEDVFNECIIGMKFCCNNEDDTEGCPFHKKSGPIRVDLLDLFKNQKVVDLADDMNELGTNVKI